VLLEMYRSGSPAPGVTTKLTAAPSAPATLLRLKEK
jgi:hypothetical protein